MSSSNDHIHAMLETLGEAHRDGAFSASKAFPWQQTSLKVTSLEHRRLSWIRVGAPLAAAAAVAVVFVGPNLISTPKTISPINLIESTSSTPVQVAELSTAAKAPTTASAVKCDYNGDGVIDGRDIQAFVSRLDDTDGNPQLEADFLQRCLLGP